MDWNNIQYFEESEFDDPLYPGSGENIDPLLVFEMDSLRRATGWPIIVHTLLTTLPNGEIFSIGGAVDMYGEHGHKDDSYHLLENGCIAVDWHFKTDAPYRLQYRAVEKMGFAGIGVYISLWKWPEITACWVPMLIIVQRAESNDGHAGKKGSITIFYKE